MADACAGDPRIARAVAGIHVEGPFISPEDGPRGAHPREHVRAPDWDEFLAFQQAAGGRIRLLTLSPEWPDAAAFIRRVVASGVVVAIGHTAASPESLREAIAAGARLSTHLGNGCHAMLPRHPNYIWEQLAADELSASLIADGHHLPPSVVKTFIRAKGVNRTILVSDAVALAGMPPGAYEWLGLKVTLSSDGRIGLTGTPFLAGAALSLAAALGRVMAFAGVSMADAVTMASTNPARLLGTEGGTLAEGARADVVVAQARPGVHDVKIVQTLAGGEIV
jgi:N-acetylglucosamine-6-phosphate deacetylase